ncbi:MAG: hypothetical protein HYT93_00955 [Parcubacteria group bacterium]|nr:hypothetical protein [Parcubacteria group bacterium]
MNSSLLWLKKFLARPVFIPLWRWVDSMKVRSYVSLTGVLILAAPLSRFYSPAYAELLLGIVVLLEVMATRLNPHSSLNMWMAYRNLANVFFLTLASFFLVGGQINIITLAVYAAAGFYCMRLGMIWGRMFIGNNIEKINTPLHEHLDTKIV